MSALQVLVAGAAAIATAMPVVAQGVSARQAAIATITAEGIVRDIAVLADDSLRGRATPSRELDAAAAYVARELERAGVRPLPGRELVTRWPLVNTSPIIEGITLTVRKAGRDRPLRYGTDFAVMPAGTTPVAGRPVPVADLSDTAAIRGRIPVFRLPPGGWSGPANGA